MSSKNPQSKSSSGGGDEGTPSQEKITVPPPAMYGAAVSDDDVEEATLLAKIPDELIQSIRAEEGERAGEGGLKQLFSREPVPVPRHRNFTTAAWVDDHPIGRDAGGSSLRFRAFFVLRYESVMGMNDTIVFLVSY